MYKLSSIFAYLARAIVCNISDAVLFFDFKKPAYKHSILCARIVKRTHNIEKGLCIPDIRAGFGHEKIQDLLRMLKTYRESDFSIEHPSYQMAYEAIGAYLSYHDQIGFRNNKVTAICRAYNELSPPVNETREKHGGTLRLSKSDFVFQTSEIEHFFATRHSVRDFSNEDVDVDLIKKAVTLASKCPSACNRQATRVYVLDKSKAAVFDKWLSGTGGFSDMIDKYIIIAAKLSAYDASEPYQYIVSSSIFAGYLSLTLHLYGVGACLIQRSVVYRKKSKDIANSLGIPDDERIVMLIGCGMLKDEFKVPVSYRYGSDYIMKTIS